MARAGGRGQRARGERSDRPSGWIGLFGHEDAREHVHDLQRRERLAPVLLVTGPRGIGKETFAFWVASVLLCDSAEPRACGGCPSCGKIAALQHPDVHWFFPVPAESTPFGEAEWAGLLERIRSDPLDPSHRRFSQPASFRMHQATTIRRLAATRSFQGGERVFVLGDYEQNPSDEVHNALLKVLEEPPRRTTFVLTTSRLQGLPATILSRCRRLPLRPLPTSEMEAFLAAVEARTGAQLSAERKAELLGRAEGRPGRLLELLHDEDRAGAQAAELLRVILREGAIGSYGYALAESFRGSREEHNRRLDAISSLWRDLLRVRTGAEAELGRPDLTELYRLGAERLDPVRGAEAALELERARERIQANVYAPLVFWTVFRELALALGDAPRPHAREADGRTGRAASRPAARDSRARGQP